MTIEEIMDQQEGLMTLDGINLFIHYNLNSPTNEHVNEKNPAYMGKAKNFGYNPNFPSNMNPIARYTFPEIILIKIHKDVSPEKKKELLTQKINEAKLMYGKGEKNDKIQR